MNIEIKRIEYKYMPYTTIGHWMYSDKQLTILIATMSDWRYEASTVVHELIEALWCKSRGITTEQCDAFDSHYEYLYERGIKKISQEQGYDKKCPYYWGHVWGDIFAWVFDRLVGVDERARRAESDRLLSSARSRIKL